MTGLVVTGTGSVSAGGLGRSGLVRLLERGRPITTEVGTSPLPPRARTSTRAALCQQVSLEPWVTARQARRMSWPSRFAVTAAKMAAEEAGVDPDGLAVAIGTAFGPARFAEAIVGTIHGAGPESVSPFHFSESVANAPAGQVAIALGATGANVAVTQREASPLLAMISGAKEIRAGRATAAIVGSCDEINPLVHAVLSRFDALAPDGGSAGPFDRDRAGFVAAEGASVAVLEPAESAARRGREPFAALRGWSRGFDPTAPAWGWGDGAELLASRLARDLDRLGLGDIDLVVSGASGARAGDALEAKVLHRVFGSDLPPVVAPRGATGVYGGGLLGAALLAAEGRVFPNPKITSDPELEVSTSAVPIVGRPRRVLVSTLAAGGAAAWLVIDAADSVAVSRP